MMPDDNITDESTVAGEFFCQTCQRPLTRRGPGGECLRCLFRLVFQPEEAPAKPATAMRRRVIPGPLSYAHFDVEVGTDGFPVELGAGAMAVTYRAWDTVLQCTVALKVIDPQIAGNASGTATGPLLGGNLTLVETGLGTGDFPSLEGAIFLFEDTGEAPYSYDRMLTQLLRSGALDGIAGVAIGQFDLANGAAGEWTAAQAVSDRLEDLGVPVLGGLRIGHGQGQLTVPLGARATIDTSAGTLTLEPGVS